MTVIIPKLLLLRAREAALTCDIPMIERGIQQAMDGCDGDNATMILLGAASVHIQSAKTKIQIAEVQHGLWQAYDVVAAGWRASRLNRGGPLRRQFGGSLHVVQGCRG